MRLKKPEAIEVQGVCVVCKVNKQHNKGGGKYRPVCSGCARERSGKRRHPYKNKIVGLYRKDYCEECGFVAKHSCQLDVDHIDGNHNNNEESNLQTLCANCHRYKTWLNKDWEVRG